MQMRTTLVRAHRRRLRAEASSPDLPLEGTLLCVSSQTRATHQHALCVLDTTDAARRR